jgi:hypothetical protein
MPPAERAGRETRWQENVNGIDARPLDAGLVAKNDAQQRTVDRQLAIVVNKAKPFEFVHEEANARPGRPDHLRKRLLADLRGDRLGPSLFAKIREQQKSPGQALFARVEQVVHEVRFNATVARQQVSCEDLGKSRLCMKDADHLRFLKAHHSGVGHGSGRREAQRLRNQTAFAEKVALAKQGNYRFPSLLGDHGDFDRAPYDVKDGICGVSLRENDLFGPILQHGSAVVHGCEEYVRIKSGLPGGPCHDQFTINLVISLSKLGDG